MDSKSHAAELAEETRRLADEYGAACFERYAQQTADSRDALHSAINAALALMEGQCCEKAAGPGRVCKDCAEASSGYSAAMRPVRDGDEAATIRESRTVADHPTRSQRMREAGFTARDTRLECEKCGARCTPQMLPIHRCAPQPTDSEGGEA